MIYKPKFWTPSESEKVWHKHFVLLPTFTWCGAIVWLDWVERKRYYSSLDCQWHWSYRLPKEAV